MRFSTNGRYYYELQEYLDDMADILYRDLSPAEVTEYTRIFWIEH